MKLADKDELSVDIHTVSANRARLKMLIPSAVELLISKEKRGINYAH